MVLARRAALGTAMLCAALLTGCGSSHSSDQAAPAGSLTATPTVSSTASSSTSLGAGPSPTATPNTAPVTSKSGSAGTTAVSIPPYLCDATDIAQNAADAYMGALSAGNEKQAAACVLPGTVPAATTHSLVATVKGTAVYQPRDGVDGPTVFGYRGNGKSIDVTVTRQRDGKFWVSKVSVRNA